MLDLKPGKMQSQVFSVVQNVLVVSILRKKKNNLWRSVDDLQEQTKGTGVTNFDRTGGVEFLKEGMSIKMSNEHAEGVLRGLQIASSAVGSVNQMGNIARMASALGWYHARALVFVIVSVQAYE